ncbi:MAG: RpiB/LacA/LacB family sugar-phosphate isomerase [Spirochaetales bacterium]|nr:RpiB/LacA/LacB family sugar-phosphate isomerase [Spirochaetales bacterium]
MDKRVVIANDHGAVELKNRIARHLTELGYSVDDLGITKNETADYPDQAVKAGKAFLKGDYEFGIVCCGTGVGITMAANKIKGIRCALPQNNFAASMAKEHNNANFLAFGGRIDYSDPVEGMLDAFINSSFNNENRHSRRVDKIMNIEK